MKLNTLENVAVQLGEPKKDLPKRGWQARLLKLEQYKIEAEKQLKNQDVRREDLRKSEKGLSDLQDGYRDFLERLAKAANIPLGSEQVIIEKIAEKLTTLNKDLDSEIAENQKLRKSLDVLQAERDTAHGQVDLLRDEIAKNAQMQTTQTIVVAQSMVEGEETK